jgi:hypothetical protein
MRSNDPSGERSAGNTLVNAWIRPLPSTTTTTGVLRRYAGSKRPGVNVRSRCPPAASQASETAPGGAVPSDRFAERDGGGTHHHIADERFTVGRQQPRLVRKQVEVRQPGSGVPVKQLGHPARSRL